MSQEAVNLDNLDDYIAKLQAEARQTFESQKPDNVVKSPPPESTSEVDDASDEGVTAPEISVEDDTEKSFSLFTSSLADGERIQISSNVNDREFDKILFWGKSKNVSDFSFRSGDYVRGQVKGGWRRLTSRAISHHEISSIISTIDTVTTTSDLEKGHDVDRSYAPRDEENKAYRFRLNITHIKSPVDDGSGYNLIIRILPEKPPTVDELGIERDIVDNFFKKNSLSLVTGGTGHGKSTLNYSLLQHMVALGKETPTGYHILDYSKPIEYTINDIESETFLSQMEVGSMLRDFHNNSESAQWQYAVRNAVRRKPDIIVVGETRDRPTFDASLNAANTGHLALTTLHNNSVASCFQRALRFYSYEERLGVATDLISLLHLIVNQELVLATGGKSKVALREYLIVNGYVRQILLSVEDVEKWPMIIHNIILSNSRLPEGERKVICQSKYHHALDRYNRGEIDEETLREIYNRTNKDEGELQEVGPQKLDDNDIF